MATIQKWGNSLAVRIPMAIAGQLAVTDGATVDLEVRDGALVVRPTQPTSLSLEELLRDCKPSQLHGETDFGADVGREIVE